MDIIFGGNTGAGALRNTHKIVTQCQYGWAPKNSGCQCTLQNDVKTIMKLTNSNSFNCPSAIVSLNYQMTDAYSPKYAAVGILLELIMQQRDVAEMLKGCFNL